MPEVTYLPTPGVLVVEPYQANLPGANNATGGQLYQSDNVKEQDLAGVVVAIGEVGVTEYGAKITCPKGIKVGSVIVHNTYYSAPYKHYGSTKRYRFVKFQEVRAVIKENGKKK